MICFSNMANLFDCDGGPYSHLDFKKVIPIKFWVAYVCVKKKKKKKKKKKIWVQF